MKDFKILIMLRNRLPGGKNRKYLAWLAEQDKVNVGHHIVGKSHDLLIAKIPDEIHKKIHNGIHVDGCSEEELLLNAIEWDHKYIVYLQEQLGG